MLLISDHFEAVLKVNFGALMKIYSEGYKLNCFTQKNI